MNLSSRHDIRANLRVVSRLLVLVLSIMISNSFAQADKNDGDAAKLPTVLVIGDSISIGYTPHVVRLMKDRAVVRHNRGNAQHSGTGLKKLDQWLGKEKWDVIHFNWGLWDLCYRNPKSKTQGNRDKVNGKLTTSLKQYEKNLEQLVVRLKQTQAVLIWAHTTVVPEGEAGRKVGDDQSFNAAAARVMQKHGVRINDLHTLTKKFEKDLFVAPGNVHFKKQGSVRIAKQVAQAIRGALADRNSKAAAESATKPIKRILFGSCVKQDKPVPIFDTIVQQNPELFIFLGDNIYADTDDMDVMRAKYAKLAAHPGFANLRRTCPILATWDDHDYGRNDAGADYKKRAESQQIFLDFWKDDRDSPRRKRAGVYDARVIGPKGRRIQIILLDTRYFRSALKKGERRVGGPYLPDGDPNKTMLGDAQWKWLETQLQVPAELRIIATSIQCISQDAGQETWSNLPKERQRLFQLIDRTNANGVVFISGDRHWAELSVVSREVAYPLYDLTSSSFNQTHSRGTPTKNRFRAQPQTFHRENFGVISIDWNAKDPKISLQVRDLDNKVQINKQLKLSDLQADR